MIHVLSCISYDADLLPHFVEYYRSIAVDSFIIAVDERVPGIYDRTAAIAANLPAKIRLVPASDRQRMTGMEGNNKEETRRRFVEPEDWIIPADLDEFIHFPVSLAQLIAEMKAAGATFIMGSFTDRISQDGTLTPTRPTPSIWDQYPLQAPLSQQLVGCWCQKVTLCRGDCELTSGHHNVIRPAMPLVDRRCDIHHFKWRAGLLEALQRRMQIYLKANYGARPESERIVDYLEKHGRIVPEEFNAVPGWFPAWAPPRQNQHVIYTAISDGYDPLREPPAEFRKGSELVAFVEGEQTSSAWKVAELHREFTDPCRNAKTHKILPHLFFPDAKYSLWIDGSVEVRCRMSLEELAAIYLADHDIAVFPHRLRACIYDEAEACILAGKDDPETIRRQIRRYQYEQYPQGVGLAECPIILRRHTPQVRLFNEVWWDEIRTQSRRDQLSFNYVSWKLQIRYAVFPGKVDQSDLFFVHPHVPPAERGPKSSAIPASLSVQAAPCRAAPSKAGFWN